MRHGVMNSLEALLGAIIFLFFIIVAGSGGVVTGVDTATQQRLHTTLETVDANGSLREPLMDRSLETIDDRLSQWIDGQNTAVAGLYVNQSTGTMTADAATTATVTIDADQAERVVLHLWFDTAESPVVTVNGETVIDAGGTVDGYRQALIQDVVTAGDDTLNVTDSSGSTVEYSIDTYELVGGDTIPDDNAVTSASYLVAGQHSSFAPVEVIAAAWQ